MPAATRDAAQAYAALCAQEMDLDIGFFKTLQRFPAIAVDLVDASSREQLEAEIARLEAYDDELLKATHDLLEMQAVIYEFLFAHAQAFQPDEQTEADDENSHELASVEDCKVEMLVWVGKQNQVKREAVHKHDALTEALSQLRRRLDDLDFAGLPELQALHAHITAYEDAERVASSRVRSLHRQYYEEHDNPWLDEDDARIDQRILAEYHDTITREYRAATHLVAAALAGPSTNERYLQNMRSWQTYLTHNSPDGTLALLHLFLVDAIPRYLALRHPQPQPPDAPELRCETEITAFAARLLAAAYPPAPPALRAQSRAPTRADAALRALCARVAHLAAVARAHPRLAALRLALEVTPASPLVRRALAQASAPALRACLSPASLAALHRPPPRP
jgi:hypothetical protein